MQNQTLEDEIVSLRAEVERLRERDAASREILTVINQSREDERLVFEIILKKAAVLCGADQAGLQLVNEGRSHIRLAADLGHKRTAFELGKQWPIDAPISSAASIRSGKIIHILDYAETELYKNGNPTAVHAVETEGVRTRLVVPLLQNGIAIGTIALSRHDVLPFGPSEIQLVETFAEQAVIAIENVRQFKALEQLNAELEERVKEQVSEIERIGRLKRFLPSAVADTVISLGADKILSSHRALLGVLFCDIRGFTSFCETAEPEETIELLQTYHEEMGRLINLHGAGVDHRMGDGIMVLFNDPLPCDDPAGDAVRLALAMHVRMAELSKQWKRMGYKLGFGVGVSLGYATIGMVGFEDRLDYTASGTAINLASRLCDEAHDGEILLSPKAWLAIEGNFSAESRGELSLKGLREPLEVFKLTGGAARS
ncbi:MAG: adenylate/guanylate cyclase domain-containing protein [Sulfitobacter sp.]|nr:adenylate/guanylate cyclase domain-containing protein [Sulfitobacter sp.]